MTEIHTDALSPENLSPGRTLAAARQARGMSVEDVAQRLKFGSRQIEALEADDYAALPGSVIVRGMIRNYSRLLGLDANALMGDLQRRIEPDPVRLEQSVMKVPLPTGPKRGSRLYAMLSVVVVIAVAAVVADWVLREREAAVVSRVRTDVKPAAAAPTGTTAAEPPVAAAPAVEPQPEPPTPAAAAAAASLSHIELAFERDSWVEIKDADGAVLTSSINRGGSTRSVEGKPPFALVIGNASGVRLRYNGADVNLAPHTRVDVARLTLE
jgi:cytoskeleton protein RodZ